MTPDKPKPTILNPDRSINYDAVRDQFGLGEKEANTRIRYGSYRGTVAEMLADDRCPEGGRLRGVYREKGLDGIRSEFSDYNKKDSGFKVEFTEETIARERDKKKIEEVSSNPQQASEVQQDNQIPEVVETKTPTQEIPQVEAPTENFVQEVQTSEKVAPVAPAVVAESVPQSPVLETVATVPIAVIEQQPEKSVAPAKVEEPTNRVLNLEKVHQEQREVPIVTSPQRAQEVPVVVQHPREIPIVVMDEQNKREQSKATARSDGEGQNTRQDTEKAEAVDKKDQPVMSVAEKYAIPPATVEAVTKIIDAFLDKGEKVLGDTAKEKDDVLKDVKVVEKDGKVVIGIQTEQRDDQLADKKADSAQDGQKSVEPQLKPITSVEQLEKVLGELMKLTQEGAGSLDTVKQERGENILQHAKDTTLRRDQAARKELPKDITILVSDEVLAFFKQGKDIFDEVEQKEIVKEGASPKVNATEKVFALPQEQKVGQLAPEEKQKVKIMAGQKELFIELATLKKILELLRERKNAKKASETEIIMPMLEEQGLHGSDYQNYADDKTPFLDIQFNKLLADVDNGRLLNLSQQQGLDFPRHVLHA